MWMTSDFVVCVLVFGNLPMSVKKSFLSFFLEIKAKRRVGTGNKFVLYFKVEVDLRSC